MFSLFGVSITNLMLIPVLASLVYPWFLVYKHLDSHKTTRQGPSHIWILILIFAPIIGAILYVHRHLDEPKHSWVARLTGAFLLIYLATLGSFVLSYQLYYKPTYVKHVDSVKQSLAASKNTALRAEEFKQLYADLDALKAGLDTNPITQENRIYTSNELLILLSTYLRDNNLSRSEFLNWKSLYYASRNVKLERIRDYVRQTQAGREPASIPKR